MRRNQGSVVGSSCLYSCSKLGQELPTLRTFPAADLLSESCHTFRCSPVTAAGRLRTLDDSLAGTVSRHSYSCLYGTEPDLAVAALCAQPVSYPIKLSA
jgi:hypothetical protein